MPRKKGYNHSEESRSKIQTTQIINRLSKHIDGECDMSQSQVNAAKVLLNKVLPDLKSTDLTGNVNHEAGDGLTQLLTAINGKTRSV